MQEELHPTIDLHLSLSWIPDFSTTQNSPQGTRLISGSAMNVHDSRDKEFRCPNGDDDVDASLQGCNVELTCR